LGESAGKLVAQFLGFLKTFEGRNSTGKCKCFVDVVV
jgi:hypothetical protein